MGRSKFKIKYWVWVSYPILVATFIAISAIVVLNNKDKFAAMVERKEKIAVEEARIAGMKKRLAILQSLDVKSESENLKQMIRAVPTSKMVWSLVTELKQAAADTGAVLETYKGSVGNVKEASAEAELVEENTPFELDVTYEVADLEQLGNLLKNLESRVPLIKVNKMRYGAGLVDLTIEGAWKAWESVVDPGADLPEYQSDLEKVKMLLAGFVKFDELSVEGSETGTGVINPF